MTQQHASGTDGSQDKVIVEGNLNELKGGDGISISDDTTYEFGADLNADPTPLIDPGTGKTISIRLFEYKMDPRVKQRPERQALFDAHAKQILTMLWADGLRPMEEVAPRVIIDMKKREYKIFVPAEARLNAMFMDKAKTLSESLIHKK